MRRFLILLILPLAAPSATAQNKALCGQATMQTATDTGRLRTIDSLALRPSPKADSVRVIPVVVHVMHNYDWEKIDAAQVQDGIRKLNEDFRRRNADTAETRDYFRPYAADCYFEFRLARIDPDGNCTTGITFHDTPLTYHTYDTIKSIVAWPSDRYFNIWIVNTIDADYFNLNGITVIGYEQFPWTYGINETYGAVVKHDYWGNTGTGINHTTLHTEAHEVGHCFGLYHLWHDPSGSGNDGCTLTAGNDCTLNNDKVCDTPPMAAAAFDCDTLQNSCVNDTVGSTPYFVDSIDQIENFMTYDRCRNMFTVGQKQRMDAVFQTYPELQNLISQANHVATGIDSSYSGPACKPAAAFFASGRGVCAGNTVTFTDDSWNGTPTAWAWQFPGGSPPASSDRNPVITYNTPGQYDVQLIASNAGGSDTVTLPGHITVYPLPPDYNVPPYTDGFEDSTLTDSLWLYAPSQLGHRWENTAVAAYTGDRCMMANNHQTLWKKERVELMTPAYDLSQLSQAELIFKVAYAKRDNNSDDILSILQSTDCGQTWQPRADFNTAALLSAPDQLTPFVPAGPSEWREKNIYMASSLAGQTNVRFKFVFRSWEGNNLYLDDILIRDKPTGLEEAENKNGFTLHPNPARGELFLGFPSPAQRTVAIYDLLQREVMRVQVMEKDVHLDLDGSVPAGVYMLRVTEAFREVSSQRLVVF